MVSIQIFFIETIYNFAVNGSHQGSMCKIKTYQNDKVIVPMCLHGIAHPLLNVIFTLD